jgi:hypothetical protein
MSGCTAIAPTAIDFSARKRLALLLTVDFANHRHPFFDLSQHAQIGGARVQ